MKTKLTCFAVLLLMALSGCMTSNEPLPVQTTSSDDSVASSAYSSQQQIDMLPDSDSLDLRSQIDLMIYLKQVLKAISQKDMLMDLQDFQIHTIDRNFKNGSIVCTIDYTRGILLHIIIDETTGDYFYVFAEEYYDILDFDDEKIQFSNLSGTLIMNFKNFPYMMTHMWADDSWEKIHLPINNAYCSYILDGHFYAFGKLEGIEIEQEKAKLVFRCDELMQKQPSISGALPITRYSFDPISQTATLSFSGIELSGGELASKLQQINGITGVEIKEIDAFAPQAKDAGITGAIEIIFKVSDKYNLYAEREETDWDGTTFTETGEMFFGLWTEMKI